MWLINQYCDNTYMFNSISTMAIYPDPIFFYFALDIFGFTVVHVMRSTDGAPRWSGCSPPR